MSEPSDRLRTARERTIDVLCQRFADDALSMGELERRLTKAREARSRQELDALLGDLVASTPPVQTAGPREKPARQPSESVRVSRDAVRTSSHAAIAIMGGTRRAGRWAPPTNMVAVAIMGGVELDFRDAVLGGGVTEINCFAFWGGVEITVPPDVHVDTHGFALLGAFEEAAEQDSNPAPDAPVIRVNGFALMGGVEVKVRDRGDEGGRRRKR
ncbi:MAG: DUF1707 domain-containing protein, partial [Gemmatimonadetes bacterium]|nr:DUF1707 domain-containing protein [Gemmatimonadota bacterium]